MLSYPLGVQTIGKSTCCVSLGRFALTGAGLNESARRRRVACAGVHACAVELVVSFCVIQMLYNRRRLGIERHSDLS